MKQRELLKPTWLKLVFFLENKLSLSGDKNIYIRVIDQNQKTLQFSEPITIQNESGDNIEVSSKRVVNYQNENMDVCIYHELKGS